MTKYENCLLTFIDILGFRSLVTRTPDPAVIAEQLRVFSRISNPSYGRGAPDHYSFVTFSDLSVRVMPIRERQPPPEENGLLYGELLDLAFIQAELLQRGLLLRGAVTVGEICVENGLISGQH